MKDYNQNYFLPKWAAPFSGFFYKLLNNFLFITSFDKLSSSYQFIELCQFFAVKQNQLLSHKSTPI